MKLALPLASWLFLGSLATLAGCGSEASAPACSTGSTGGTGGSGTTTGGSSGQGGFGGDGERIFFCDVPTDCPGVENDCATRSCQLGRCVQTFLAEGAPTAQQVPGDCKTRVCDGKGGTSEAFDNADLPDDKNPCTTDVCANGEPANLASSAGLPCDGTNDGRKCDGSGHCVQCLDASSCQGLLCKDHQCVALTCDDQQKDGPESDIDCGGDCPPCASGQKCVIPPDCQSGICTNGVCQP